MTARTLRLTTGLFAGSLLAAGAVALPANAAGPVVTGGLVNVTVTDVANNNTVEVLKNVNVGVGAALGIAANVCGVTVNVLAAQLGTPGPISCTSTSSGQTATITQLAGR